MLLTISIYYPIFALTKTIPIHSPLMRGLIYWAQSVYSCTPLVLGLETALQKLNLWNPMVQISNRFTDDLRRLAA